MGITTEGKKAAFNDAADTTLQECLEIHAQRGGEYHDSWALENQKTTFIDATLRLLGIENVTDEGKRLLMAAALVDVKDSRMNGKFNPDSVIDGINYRAVWVKWAKDLLAEFARMKSEPLGLYPCAACGKDIFDVNAGKDCKVGIASNLHRDDNRIDCTGCGGTGHAQVGGGLCPRCGGTRFMPRFIPGGTA